MPSVSGQANVIRRALSNAGLDSGHIDYIEAHGTGTEIGDPVEARALGEVFAQRQHRPLSVGSVKTNIGHAGGAAGIAGLLKTVLAIENAMIPPSLNYADANPRYRSGQPRAAHQHHTDTVAGGSMSPGGQGCHRSEWAGRTLT